MPFQIIRNDITKVKADIIVNTANPEPVIGSGTDSAIYAAAGAEKLLIRRQKIGRIAPGDAAVTPAFHLHAKHIIHTVGPVWLDGNHGEREILRSCYARSLALATDLRAKSIAFPLISTGVYGFPKDEALNIALSEISRFLFSHDMHIIMVVFDRNAFELSEKLVGEIDAFIDDHGVAAIRETEYGDSPFRTERRGSPTDPRPVPPPMQAQPGKQDQRRDSALNMYAPQADISLQNHPAQADSLGPDDLLGFTQGHDAEQTDSLLTEAKPLAEAKSRPAAKSCAPLVRPAPKSIVSQARHELKAGSARDARPSRKETEDASFSTPKPLLCIADNETSLDDVLKRPGETFQQRLLHLIDSSGMSDAAVYKKANIDRRVFSKIRSRKDYKPKKNTAVAFAIALELDKETMEDLLSRAGFAFSPSDRFDLIIQFFVSRRNYDIFEINAALFKYGQPILGEA